MHKVSLKNQTLEPKERDSVLSDLTDITLCVNLIFFDLGFDKILEKILKRRQVSAEKSFSGDGLKSFGRTAACFL